MEPGRCIPRALSALTSLQPICSRGKSSTFCGTMASVTLLLIVTKDPVEGWWEFILMGLFALILLISYSHIDTFDTRELSFSLTFRCHLIPRYQNTPFTPITTIFQRQTPSSSSSFDTRELSFSLARHSGGEGGPHFASLMRHNEGQWTTDLTTHHRTLYYATQKGRTLEKHKFHKYVTSHYMSQYYKTQQSM